MICASFLAIACLATEVISWNAPETVMLRDGCRSACDSVVHDADEPLATAHCEPFHLPLLFLGALSVFLSVFLSVCDTACT